MYLQRRYEADISDGQPLAKAATAPPDVIHTSMNGHAAPVDTPGVSAPELPPRTLDEVSQAGPLVESTTDLVKRGIAPVGTQAASSPIATDEQSPTMPAEGTDVPPPASCFTAQPLAAVATELPEPPAPVPQLKATKDWVAGLDPVLPAANAMQPEQGKPSPEAMDEMAKSAASALFSRGHVFMASRGHTTRTGAAGERQERSSDDFESRRALCTMLLPLSSCPGPGSWHAAGGLYGCWHSAWPPL